MVRSTVCERWFFYQDSAGLWKWARLDILGTILAHSGSSFASRADCVEHARSSGYGDERTAVCVYAPPHAAPAGVDATSRL